jgi:hypothetical protein
MAPVAAALGPFSAAVGAPIAMLVPYWSPNFPTAGSELACCTAIHFSTSARSFPFPVGAAVLSSPNSEAVKVCRAEGAAGRHDPP